MYLKKKSFNYKINKSQRKKEKKKKLKSIDKRYGELKMKIVNDKYGG